jgi:pimeloyl-ACP methyl ester carboxylesterase
VPRRLVALPLIVALLPAAGFAQPDRVAREVLVDGHVMHFEISGRADGPTVVFEAGAQTTLSTWSILRPLLDGDARLVAYDRPGLGQSAPCSRPETARRVADELHEALRALGLSPPYVLVGLSLGGPYVRVFTSLYPTEVRGLVLVDPAHERFFERVQREFPESWAMMLRDPGFPRGPAVDSTLAQAAASDPLPPIPVVVLTRDDFGRDAPELGQLWTEVNRAWAAQMPTARHMVVPHSGHRIQMDRPAVVAEIVRGVLARARAPAHPEGPQDESSP